MSIGRSGWIALNIALLSGVFVAAWFAVNAPRLAQPGLRAQTAVLLPDDAPPLPPQSFVGAAPAARDPLARQTLFDAPAGDGGAPLDGRPALMAAAMTDASAASRPASAPIARTLLDAPLAPPLVTESLSPDQRALPPRPELGALLTPPPLRQFISMRAAPETVRRSDRTESAAPVAFPAAADPAPAHQSVPESLPETLPETPPVPEPISATDAPELADAAIVSSTPRVAERIETPRMRPAEIAAELAHARDGADGGGENGEAGAAGDHDDGGAPIDGGEDVANAAPGDLIRPGLRPPDSELFRLRVERGGDVFDAPADVTAEGMVLLGVFVGPTERRALLRTQDGAREQVTLGDEVDGWTVADITETSLTLRSGAQTQELALPH